MSELPTAPERLLTYSQTAEWLNVSKRTIERLVKRHELVAVRVGSEPRLDPADVRAYLETSRRDGAGSRSTERLRVVGVGGRSTSFVDRVRSER